jgi:hypothetical protein
VQKDRAVRLPGVKTVPDGGPILARALQPLAQLSRNRRKRVLFEVPSLISALLMITQCPYIAGQFHSSGSMGSG